MNPKLPQGARAILSPELYDQWSRGNAEAFERLPADVRLAIRETNVECDCMKLLKALELGVPEGMVIDAIFAEKAKQAKRLH